MAADIVGAQHVGAWVEKKREEVLEELPLRLLALTDGELGHVTIERIETRAIPHGDELWMGPSYAKVRGPTCASSTISA